MMLYIFASFLTAFLLTYIMVPSVLRVARARNLFDLPDERKVHHHSIPALGGVAIFGGILFSVLFWMDITDANSVRWLVLSLIIIFFLGLKDDVVTISPYKKLLGEIVAAGILIINGNVRIHNLQGLLSIYELPYVVSVALTLLVFIVIINAFNLIDGIDGLAGGVGIISCIAFGSFFLLGDQLHLGIISFATAGALLAFLRYNFSPAVIFMGDGGSLLIGFILAILCVNFIDLNVITDAQQNLYLNTPAVALAILIIPLTDTLRVFIIRVIQGRSPFSPDRNHLHHILLNLGLTHRRTSLTLYSVNGLFIWLALSLNGYGVNFMFAAVVGGAYVINLSLYTLRQREKVSLKGSRMINALLRR
jgi:UDP-GlcNAc:undecaprenyl-phosphate/decaprenyl-phosphate GlcNAc-1-phosphate transferase